MAALASAAAPRVVVFASALPFFHINDEHQYVDAILRYSRGQLSGAQMSRLYMEIAQWSLLWGSSEYLEAAPPDPYLRQEGATPNSPTVRHAFQGYSNTPATEFDSPPVFYALAADRLRVLRG